MVHNGEDYVVVHKPAGVQVAATVDNMLENVLFSTAQVSGPAANIVIQLSYARCEPVLSR